MTTFRYQALQMDGTTVEGVVDADNRRSALQALGRRGLFPSRLEPASGSSTPSTPVPSHAPAPTSPPAPSPSTRPKSTTATSPAAALSPSLARLPWRSGVRRRAITDFTRELSALLGAAIPIPQALDSLGHEEENPVLRETILQLAADVRKGSSLSHALEQHPRLFTRLYASMVRVGEEAGALPGVMNDLAALLEHEDEVRGEVVTAVAYPLFVLAFGILTVAVLLTVVLPRVFTMLEEMLPVLPLPTLVLLRVSAFLHHYWPGLLVAVIGGAAAARHWLRTPHGAETWDTLRLRLPFVGPLLLTAALGRFARTLGTLARSGVSLLPALHIVEDTIGNRILARQIARVAEETRGGDSLATPLRKLGIFPRSVVQMIEVGEESGRLDDMLLKVAEIEERNLRARTKTLISLLAPILILVVGALVGFMVIALLLPIFRMSRAIQ